MVNYRIYWGFSSAAVARLRETNRKTAALYPSVVHITEFHPRGALAQLVERFHGMEEVRSSILLSSTIL